MKKATDGKKTEETLDEHENGQCADCCESDVCDAQPAKESDKDAAYAELLDRYQRTLAEFDNFRKRTLKEKSAAYDDGIRDAVEKFLPALDNFERALASNEGAEDKFYQGVTMIARQIETILEDLDVERVGGAGEAFDHNLHFAVAHVEDAQYGANEIIEEMQKGYTHRGKVIRPSMVKVAN
jgi:molecular chaperone GrpE